MKIYGCIFQVISSHIAESISRLISRLISQLYMPDLLAAVRSDHIDETFDLSRLISRLICRTFSPQCERTTLTKLSTCDGENGLRYRAREARVLLKWRSCNGNTACIRRDIRRDIRDEVAIVQRERRLLLWWSSATLLLWSRRRISRRISRHISRLDDAALIRTRRRAQVCAPRARAKHVVEQHDPVPHGILIHGH